MIIDERAGKADFKAGHIEGYLSTRRVKVGRDLGRAR